MKCSKHLVSSCLCDPPWHHQMLANMWGAIGNIEDSHTPRNILIPYDSKENVGFGAIPEDMLFDI